MNKSKFVVEISKDELLRGKYEIQENNPCFMLLRSVVEFNVDEMKKALEKGADVNCATADGYTPIALASIFEGELITPEYKIIKTLINKGADVTIPNNSGKLPYQNYIDKLGPIKSLIFKKTKEQAVKKNDKELANNINYFSL